MALPGEGTSEYPEMYLTKIPRKNRRREKRWSKKVTSESALLVPEVLSISPSFIVHENDVLYFDYGAVKFGRTPQPDGPDGARVVCVGLGWLPDWEFTINSRGLPDIAPTGALCSSSVSSSKYKDGRDESGVLGLLYKLVLDEPPRRMGRSLFSKKLSLDVKDMSYATPKAWNAAIPFHPKLKVLQRVKLYIHVFDGGVGHKYQKDGRVIPFRTPEWPVKVVVHIDPPRPPIIRGELRVSKGKLQGDWVAKELNRWIKDAKLPRPYVDQWLREWVPGNSKKKSIAYKKKDRSGIWKFMGFRQ